VFVLRLEAKPGTDAIHALRRLLKVVGRQFQLRCVDAYEIPQPKPERTRAYATKNPRRIARQGSERISNRGNREMGEGFRTPPGVEPKITAQLQDT
jgi:hypothetical protein